MPLTWDLSEIQDYKDKCWIRTDDDKVTLNPLTECIIWTTMSVGLGKITEENWSEFYGRMHLQEQIYGKMLIDDGKLRHIHPYEVRDHIGLSTNVSNETLLNWLKKFKGVVKSSAARAEQAVKKEKVSA